MDRQFVAQVCSNCMITAGEDVDMSQAFTMTCPMCDAVLYTHVPKAVAVPTSRERFAQQAVHKVKVSTKADPQKDGAPDDWIAAPLTLSPVERETAFKLLAFLS